MAINLIDVENRALDYYLKSGDFNGISIANLSTSLGVDFDELREIILEGIASERLRIISSDHELNPHIIREGFRDKEIQINSVRSDNLHHTCIYPSMQGKSVSAYFLFMLRPASKTCSR